MMCLLRTVIQRRHDYGMKLLGRYGVLSTRLFALAALLAFVGIVDWPNIPFAIAAAVLGGLLVFSVVGFGLGLLFL
jgi:hypothetical protein